MSGLDGLGWPNPEDEPKSKKTINSQLEIKLAPTPESDAENQRIMETTSPPFPLGSDNCSVSSVCRPRLRISFSGGRTSALMTRLCVERMSATHDILITFANTGCEHEKTLDFVNQCDKHFGWGVVWLESVFNLTRGKGVVSKVVSYETASRNGEPFEGYIQKNGLPNTMNPRCTDRLKEMCMDHYTHKVQGWKRGSYQTVIGIRADEIDRVNPDYKEKGFMYPLADWGYRKDDVKAALMAWPFDLDLESEAYGNCTWCWKKSHRKLLTVAKHHPEHFDFPVRMEAKYGKHRISPDEPAPRVMFRKNKSAAVILEEAKTTAFREYSDNYHIAPSLFTFDMDYSIGCGESCEIGSSFSKS